MNHQQWQEQYASKKRSMGCVDCHDPHQSAVYGDADMVAPPESPINPNRGIRKTCVGCHPGYATNQKSVAMAGVVDCVDCHMPRLVKSANGDVTKYSGDMRTHLFDINPSGSAPQFTPDGSSSMPHISLDWACRSCHRDDGSASLQTDEELETLATGYHLP